MPRQVLLFSGASAVGKTSVLKSLLPLLARGGMAPCVCKIDCLKTGDADVFQSLGLPCVTGLSGDICPDHFLVSNLSELWGWADRLGRDALVIETAGLCHRCSPATEHMAAGCVLDCTASCRASGQLGPMLTQADFVVLTKIDMVSQAELEIISWQIRILNPGFFLHFVTVAGTNITDNIQCIHRSLDPLRPRFNDCNFMPFFTELFGQSIAYLAAACNNNFHSSTSKIYPL